MALLLLQVFVLWPADWYRDSRSYVSYARDLADGAYTPTGDPGAHRFVLLAPMALCLRVLGPEAPNAAWFVVACAVGLVVAGQAAATRWFDARVGFVTGVLLAMSPLTVLYAVPVMGDVPVGFACAMAYFWAAKPESRASVAAAGLAIGLGYWIKETAAFAGAFLAAWLWFRNRRALAWFLGVAAVPMLAGHAFLFAHTGSPFVSAEALYGGTMPYYRAFQPWGEWWEPWYRWTVQWFVDVLLPHSGEFSLMGPMMWAALLGARRVERERRPLLWGVLLMWALLAWFPMSLRPPIPAFLMQARYLSIALVPAAALAAAGIVRARRRWPAAVLLLCFTAASVNGALFRRARVEAARSVIARVEAREPALVYADRELQRYAFALATRPVEWRHVREIVGGESRGAVVAVDEQMYAAWHDTLDAHWRLVETIETPAPRTGRHRLRQWLAGEGAPVEVHWIYSPR